MPGTFYYMGKRILLGYTGSFAFGMKTFYQMERLRKNPHDRKAKAGLGRIRELREKSITPVYVSAKKYKELKRFKELKYLNGFL